MAVTFADLVQDNAFALIGTISRLLKEVDRFCETSVSKEYSDKAFAAGSHDELVRISHEYASQYCATTLDVRCDAEFFVAVSHGVEDADCNSEWEVNV